MSRMSLGYFLCAKKVHFLRCALSFIRLPLHLFVCMLLAQEKKKPFSMISSLQKWMSSPHWCSNEWGFLATLTDWKKKIRHRIGHKKAFIEHSLFTWIFSLQPTKLLFFSLLLVNFIYEIWKFRLVLRLVEA